MNFLKAIGQILATGLRIVGAFAPVVQQLAQQAAPVVTEVDGLFQRLSAIVISAEAAGASLGISGPDKAKIAAAEFSQVFLQIADLAGHKVADGPKFTGAMVGMAGSFADFLSSMSHETITAAPPNPIPAPPAP